MYQIWDKRKLYTWSEIQTESCKKTTSAFRFCDVLKNDSSAYLSTLHSTKIKYYIFVLPCWFSEITLLYAMFSVHVTPPLFCGQERFAGLWRTAYIKEIKFNFVIQSQVHDVYLIIGDPFHDFRIKRLIEWQCKVNKSMHAYLHMCIKGRTHVHIHVQNCYAHLRNGWNVRHVQIHMYVNLFSLPCASRLRDSYTLSALFLPFRQQTRIPKITFALVEINVSMTKIPETAIHKRGGAPTSSVELPLQLATGSKTDVAIRGYIEMKKLHF